QAEQVAPQANPHGVDVRELHSTEHVQVVMITLGPGEGLKPHITPVDAFFYGLEGEGLVKIGDETADVARDTLVHSPAGVVHTLWNEGDTVFRFLVVKTPRQTNPSRLL
ncbi:MAG: cupin domain-containing protein, partial [Anaerolineae bacterium]|nr:cupin domain-containing protein [Anaerolineae bacterium]